MFNFKKEVFDHRQGSMIDGRTVSRVAPCPGSPQLRVDLAAADDVTLTACKVTRTSPLLSVHSKTSILYELEVTTSQGVYYIDRTFEELAELNTVLKDLPTLKKTKSVRGALKKPNKPKSMDKHRQKWNERFEAYIKQASQAAILRTMLAPRSKPRHLLFIDIIEARNLVSTDMNGKSDPYLRVSMVDVYGKVIGQPALTPVVHKSLDPVWNEQVAFELDDSVDSVTLSCWDHDRISRDDFMGRIMLKKRDIPHNTEVRRWFPLHPSKSRQNSVHGEVLLRIHYKTQIPGGIDLDVKPNEELNDKAIAACKAERERRQRKREKHRFAGELHIKTLYNPPLGNWGGYLTITVVEARKLLALDSGGTSDPYCVLSLNGKRFRTKKVTNSLDPTWGETFYYHIPAGSVEGLAVEVDVYDWDVVGKSEAIGDASIRVEELSEGFDEKWITLVAPPPTQDGLDKKIGRRMAEEGWAPNLPIILVPGFGSTSLEVVEGYEKWKGQRVWLSLSKISREALSFRRFTQGRATRRLDVNGKTITGDFEAIELEEEWEDAEARLASLGMSLGSSTTSMETTAVSAVDPAVERAFKNRWIQHLCLQEDGISDPEGIKVRPVKGVEAVTYLDPGALTAPLSYVMGPLVENLQQLGYVYGDNLLAAGYDWRLPLHHLEERDGYFTQLKQDIQDMCVRNNSPVVLMGHSMGNRVIQYFLNWVCHTDPTNGRKWISTNVHTFVAVGAPWLGASKTIRALATGEKFGLDAFLTDVEAITFGHRISSTACLLPVGCEKLHHHLTSGLESFTHLNDAVDACPKPMHFRDFLTSEVAAHGPMMFYEEYMRKNPLFGGEHKDEYILKPPPVDRLYAIYGVNLETEIGYVFKRDAAGCIVLDDSISKAQRTQLESEGFAVKKGIVWETPRTKQGIVRELTGVDAHICGDGTVTYASLNHCARWRNEIPKLKIEELEGAEHRQVLANRLFFKKLIEYIAERNIIGNHFDLGKLAGRLKLRSDQFLGLDDVNDGDEIAEGGSPKAPSP